MNPRDAITNPMNLIPYPLHPIPYLMVSRGNGYPTSLSDNQISSSRVFIIIYL